MAPSMGGSNVSITVSYEAKVILLDVWDTAEQERFQTLALMYCRDRNGIVFVCDLTNHLFFENIRPWHQTISESFDIQSAFILSNKTALPNCFVTAVKGFKLASPLNWVYFEMSVKEQSMIDDLQKFLAMAVVGAGNGGIPAD
jgi:GTPase SAR1 family protein